MQSGGAIGGLDEIGSVIIDLVREGRRLLTNSYQVRYHVTSLEAETIVLVDAVLGVEVCDHIISGPRLRLYCRAFTLLRIFYPSRGVAALLGQWS